MPETETAAIDLPEDYYFSNFHEILKTVAERYTPLLSDTERTFLDHFHQASEDCQKLFVRLISRKGPWFLVEKLIYPEIASISQAIVEGLPLGLFQELTQEHLENFILCLTTSELKTIATELSLHIRHSRKHELMEGLLSQAEPGQLLMAAQKHLPAISPIGHETLRVFLLLYFGNCNQDLTEFVLQDLGLLVFENYEILPEHRLFEDRASIEQRLLIDSFNELSYLLVEEQAEPLMAELIKALEQTAWGDKLKNRVSRVYNRFGTYFERQGELETALKLFEKSVIHPAGERQARIWDKLGNVEKAKTVAEQLLEISQDEEELEFARKFIPRCQKKLGIPVPPTKRANFPTVEMEITKVEGQAIEHTVLEALEDKHGFYCENQLWRSLFGLAFWDIIFQSVPGAFQNPFQRGPLDLYHSTFVEKRKPMIAARLAAMETQNDFAETLLERFDEKYGIVNPFVSWDESMRHCLQKVLEFLKPPLLAKVFEKLLRDLRRYRVGFPDLFVYSEETQEYALWEVKGPGDTLRPVQKMWLMHFQECGIPASVLKVHWKKED